MAGVVRQLLERGEELARIEQAVAAVRRGHGGVLVIQGAAGIGKSSLLRAVCEHAAIQQVHTLTARASELERDFGFGVVRQLLEMRLIRATESERAELLAGAAALAGPVLGLGGAVGDSFAALHGLYWLVANLAIGGPAVLAVDDLQWADEPSLRWLVYLWHRLEGLPVLVAATTRPPRSGHSPLLTELLAVRGIQIVHPGPLSEAAVGRLIYAGLGARPDPAFVSSCAAATGGNPFMLRELILDLTADGVEPGAALAAKVAERVPGRVERTVLARLGRLDQEVAQFVHALAVLGEGSELRLVAALAGFDVGTATAAADALLTAELLAESRPLRFIHPLVHSAVYEQLAPGARAQAHARAARLLMREGAGNEQVAAQLLLCEPVGDPDAVHALRAAAAAALAGGAPDTAVGYLRRALAEPPTGSVRAAVLRELGSAEQIARDPAAVVHLELARQATTDPKARAQLADQLADVLFYSGDLARGSAVLQAGLDDLGDRDPGLEVRLYAHKAGLEIHGEAMLERLRELAERPLAASRWAQLTLACLLAGQGESRDEVASLVERGLDGGRFIADETSDALPVILAVYALVHTNELARAHELTEAMLADAQARGSVVGFVAATTHRGLAMLIRGELTEAEADIRAALELAVEHKLTYTIPMIATYLSRTLLQRGELEAAAAVLQDVTLPPAMAELPAALLLLEARGRVCLARGDRAHAVAELRRCGQIADRHRLHNPAFLAWRSALALALAPEYPEHARELAQIELQLARRADAPRAIGIALRVCGLLAEPRNRITLLEQSVAVLETTAIRLELAYSLTELGAALRRSGARTAAREPLRRALDLAHRCGATPLADQARQEILATGARPRRPWTTGVQALTPSELRVARLAAQPLSNRDIAQALFITTKTVSDHLSSTYRKLNISSRDQLAAVMAADRQ
ncbi:MAG TPA: AAA family ATPase [Pseudonocardiaceae bacterium]|nr:AAA family ATPase [Pseudonocardiaceae bacterium]